MHPRRNSIFSMLLVVFAGLLTACSGYELQGVVLPGRRSQVMVVDKDDPRLQQPGLEGASVEVTIDPASLNRTRIAPRFTDQNGHFAVPVGEFGAGLLEYKVLVTGRAMGYRSAWDVFDLPGSSKRVIIIVPEGKDTEKPPEDILGETMRIGGVPR